MPHAIEMKHNAYRSSLGYPVEVAARANKLALYRDAVQCPNAEVVFLHKAWAHHHPALDAEAAVLLREDFAGTAAVAAAWVAHDDDAQAMAIESHQPTLHWAWRQAEQSLGDRGDDLHMVHADVLDIDRPHVDITVALNFSAFIYHTREAMLAYLKHARSGLRPGGMLVMDAYGGPGAMRLGTQWRTVTPETGEPFEYGWEQHAYDALSARVDCRIHFAFADGSTRRSAFRYDWRLWTLPELTELMHAARFSDVAVWCDRYDPTHGVADGEFRPITSMHAREDWVAYVVGLK